ncbi:MAG TPA: zincin-like metallopeptidase domain-containing protein [Pirellulales bacterium]|jgi:antirestriction protein ArdC
MSSVYDIVTSRIVQQLEQGVIPWRRPWGGPDGAPRNACTRKAYRGVNVFLLGAASYDAPYWLTYRQAGLFGGHVRKGERGWPIVFWSINETADEETRLPKRRFVLRYYTVFNVEQCDGLPARVTNRDMPPALDFRPLEVCERVLAGLPADHATMKHVGNQACYVPSLDEIRMPKPDRFCSAEDYYSVLFHELTHSTGHKSRLNREGIEAAAPFGSPIYSREELVAEMGAAFLCGHCGIDVPTLQVNQAAYVAGWLHRLRGDARLVVEAAAQAQKAADWLLGQSTAEQATEAETEVAACG